MKKMRILFFLMVLLMGGIVNMVRGQEVLDWVTLADVKFEKEYSEELMLEYDVATFGDLIKQFDGKEVQISGYVIALDALGVSFVLSRNPNATCFFCGGGGPETIVDIKVKPKALKRYKMDERKTFKGILKMHTDNSGSFIYLLTEAEPI